MRVSIAQSLSWQLVSSMPIPVKGAKAVVIDSLIYIIGGYSDSIQANTKLIQEFNPQSNTWRVAGYLNASRSGLIAKNYHDSIIALGGIPNSSSLLSSMEIWKNNPSVTTASIYNLNPNFNRLYATSEILNDHLYIFGGVGGGHHGDTLKFPFIVEYSIPEARIIYTNNNLFHIRSPFHQMSALLNNGIFIFGGVYNTISRDIYKYDPLIHNYQELPIKLLRPRAGGVALVNGEGSVYILGGFNEAQQSISSTEIFTQNPTGGGYYIQNGPPLNVPRSECTAVFYDSTIYVFGGISTNGQVTSVVEKLNVISSVENDNISANNLNLVLYTNYPNPFNPTTTISWRLASADYVTLKIFDILGNEVATLVNEYEYPGLHEAKFSINQNFQSDGSKTRSKAASGVYIYQLRAGDNISTKKMLLIK